MPAVLAQLLCAARADTLALFDAVSRALPALEVPLHPALNPPRWELGHVGWFQTRWVERLPDRHLGHRANPARAPQPAHAMDLSAAALDPDALFDSTRVAHASRWSLPLPEVPVILRELSRGLASTLRLLDAYAQVEPSDAQLYFFRLALLHEDMHHEAGLYMAQALGLPLGEALAQRWRPAAMPDPVAPLAVPAGVWRSISPESPGFAFDNELGHAAVQVEAFEIEAQALRWAEFLPFAEAGGYAEPRWWTPEGWRWRTAARLPGRSAVPRYLRRQSAAWEVQRAGRWQTLDLRETACHLSAHEAQAWCAWAGRRLPTEFEWSLAQSAHPEAFCWGEVWEWTASPFTPFAGFEPHPYREYSAPWFDGRPVLKGASFLTQPRMRHPRYRNFFTPDRDDLAAGFRTCVS